MKKETKEEVQIYTAVGMLMSGVGLSVAGFIVEPTGVRYMNPYCGFLLNV